MDPELLRAMAEKWGALVAAQREALGMTQDQLAAECKVTQQTISRIERGRLIPRDGLKINLSAKLKSHPSILFPWPKAKARVAS